MAQKKGKLTLTKVAAGIGAVAGASVLLNETDNTDAVFNVLQGQDIPGHAKLIFRNLGDSKKVVPAVFKAGIATGLPPLAVVASRKLMSMLRSF